MKIRQLTYLILLLLNAFACLPEEEVVQHEAVGLQLSTDTVFFDTLFVTERSVTKRLRVFNPGNKAVVLESIALAGGAESPYTLLVNGRRGKSFGEQRLLGGDSLLVLLEAQLPAGTSPEPQLISDAVVLINRGYRQEVPVVGWGQNAQFIGDVVLGCNTVFTGTTPYVIEKSILVDSACSLTIEKGAKLYFKPGAFLYVRGTLIAEGDSSKTDRILFRNHRLDLQYENQPGQWGGIMILEGSTSNYLRYCDIRNAEVGVRVGSPDDNDEPDLRLEHCRLENHLQAGILCYTSDLVAVNTLVANCVGPAVANLAGGNYSYTHCTFANFYTGQRDAPAAVFADNTVLDNDEVLMADLRLVLQNSIIWGNLSAPNELLIDNSGGAVVAVLLEHNLIRSNNSAYAAGGNLLETSLGFVKFQNPGAYNFRPDSLSPAVNAAMPLGVEYDLSGKTRDSQPDIGALEFIPRK
ncbi:right-handed parallel beta-helix repeat-containing protein [Cesiribacter sp. SM1]|uniref:right-handed parallel beta-helix repeat-containing protein n=1 Tax=Cesiribacter sp. SM1 TaxID=2861196 RepID=UPI001CD79BC4|nr:right-handed parallel beta-helix repeat-containing protein [Cesiribacter sp. SM1]